MHKSRARFPSDFREENLNFVALSSIQNMTARQNGTPPASTILRQRYEKSRADATLFTRGNVRTTPIKRCGVRFDANASALIHIQVIFARSHVSKCDGCFERTPRKKKNIFFDPREHEGTQCTSDLRTMYRFLRRLACACMLRDHFTHHARQTCRNGVAEHAVSLGFASATTAWIRLRHRRRPPDHHASHFQC